MALSPHDNNRSELLRQLPLKPGWFIGLGIALIILGLIALIYVVGATVASVVYVGILMSIGGVLHLAHAWSSKGWRGFLFWSLSGILYLFAGLIAISNPLVGATVLTLVFGAFLIASGAFRLWIWFQNRAQAGGGWMAFSGLITLAAGLIIAAGWPGNSVWILGLILGIDLLTQGWASLLVGMAIKRSNT
ncbi:HdeD family acid-resistance protein [Alcaligenes aquatilis]|uniref:HdeD family acid-resistance protein n=1 Tax=Alcaligenes aquatilis TaxID=323284 RepID=UPI000F65C796|nr:HdeD family acid-resistance protein [Alcaligenes aquatilis]QXR37207.1 HdeD family acid-resistance protein [Alcaligenes aquatilis]